jgi:hypothetical protein
MNTQIKPLAWTPYEITAVECNNRMGFVGRAAAMFIDGIEVIMTTRNDVELKRIGAFLTMGNFDAETIYKATVINSEGIQVVIPEVTIPTLTSEVEPAPDVPREIPTFQGRPIAKYVTPTAEPAAKAVNENTPVPSTADDDEL